MAQDTGACRHAQFLEKVWNLRQGKIPASLLQEEHLHFSRRKMCAALLW
jgi:hypothetical protein